MTTICYTDLPVPIQNKAVNETDDWTLNWDSPTLGTDNIASSVWTVYPSDLRMDSQPPSFTDKTATVWLSGGTAGNEYIVTNTITTAGGRTIPASFVLDVVTYKLIRQ